jgi:hypothetical protein
VNVVSGIAVFVLFVGGLLAMALGMSAFGRWRGWGDFYAPDLERPPKSRWPLLCRLHLYHRWHTYRASEHRYQRCAGCGLTRDVPAVPPV